MSLELKLIALAKAIGKDVKALKNADGDLSSLVTTDKTNLVNAVNEIFGMISESGAVIDDSATLGDKLVAWSADKISQSIIDAKSEVKNDILDGAGEALDTLKELAEALDNDPNFAATVASQLGFRVRFDEAQVLTSPQKVFACTNIGVGNPEHDFVADYTSAKE